MNDSWHKNVKSKNREEIVRAGKSLLFERTLLNVSVKDVCELAGVSRVTYYKHFNSLDELIFEVQMDVLQEMTQYIQSGDVPESSGKARVEHMLYAWVEYAQKYKDQMKYIIFFDLYYEAYQSNEELKRKYEDFVREERSNHCLGIAIRAGIEDGSLRGSLDPVKTGHYIFQTMMGLLQRMSITTAVPEDVEFYSEITNSVVKMVMNSIEARNGGNNCR